MGMGLAQMLLLLYLCFLFSILFACESLPTQKPKGNIHFVLLPYCKSRGYPKYSNIIFPVLTTHRTVRHCFLNAKMYHIVIIELLVANTKQEKSYCHGCK